MSELKHILLIFCLCISCSLFAQKKIKNSVILSTNDTVSINDIIILKKGIAINNTFQFVRTRSNFNVPSQYEGSQQKISFFKEIDNKYYAYTFNFLVNLEEALNNGEIIISGLVKNKITPPSPLIDTIIPSSPIILYTLTDILSNIPWYKTQREINNFYSKNLKNIPKSSFGKDGYSESYLSDIFIGNYRMRMNFVINNATQTLTRVTLKPLFKLTDKNSDIIRDSINSILKSIFGEPLITQIDSSIKVHSAITKWLTDNYSVESVFMGHKDFQTATIGIQPIDKQPENQSSKKTIIENIGVKSDDFRNTKWGISKKQVQKIESAQFIDGVTDMLLYKGKIANLECQIIYQFIEDTLYNGIYLIKEKHVNNNDYISDFKNLKNLLTEKYGKPEIDKMVWKGNLYKDDVANYGMAVISGELIYVATWKTESTNIRLMLYGDNFTPSLGVMYESEKYKNLVKKNEKQEVLKDL